MLANLLLGFTQASTWLPAINSEAEFDRIAGQITVPYKLKHVRFLIDRREKNRLYFIDSKDDRHHREFASKLYLSLDSDQDFFTKNTQQDDRRFLLGWVAYQPPVKKWTFEFWDGDLVTGDMIRLTYETLSSKFFTKLTYKPNSNRQESLSSGLNIPRVLISEITQNQPYQPLNIAFAIGRLKFVRKPEDIADADPEDILVLGEAPSGTPPVSGLVFSQPTTPLSHLGLLARGWRIPSATVRNAQKSLANLEGRWVAYRTELSEYHIRAAEPDEIAAYKARTANTKAFSTPTLNLAEKRLLPLASQKASDGRKYGAKSAHLGEVLQAKIPGVKVPPGFTLPFSAYDEFVRANGLDQEIRAMLDEKDFVAGGPKRRARLADLRKRFQISKLAKPLADEATKRVKDELGGKGVFVRSSTNSEDLPNFSGAGLYTTVPNVKGDEALIEAIKTVWASVWNDDAFLARERAGIDHTKVAMGVLIQEAVPSESSGVMMTANPFDDAETGAIYISAKRGLGIRVVDGKKVPEQIVFRQRTNAVQVLTRSQDDERLVFAPGGGVVSVPTPPDRAVLSDALIRQLATVGQTIQRLFANKPQDIEWAVVGDQIYILQARPYLRS